MACASMMSAARLCSFTVISCMCDSELYSCEGHDEIEISECGQQRRCPPLCLMLPATAPADPCHIHCQQRRCPPLCLVFPRPQQILVISTVNRDDALLFVLCCHGPSRSSSYPQSTEMMPFSLSHVATAPTDPCHIHCQQRRCPFSLSHVATAPTDPCHIHCQQRRCPPLCLVLLRPRQILVISTANRDDALLFVSCCHSPRKSFSYPLSTETMPFYLSHVAPAPADLCHIHCQQRRCPFSLSHVATAPTDPCHTHSQQRRCLPLCLMLPRPQQILVISTVNRDDALLFVSCCHTPADPCHTHCQQRRCPSLCLMLPRPKQILVIPTVNRDDTLLFVSCCHGPNRSLSYPQTGQSTEMMPFSLSHVATAPTDPCHIHSQQR